MTDAIFSVVQKPMQKIQVCRINPPHGLFLSIRCALLLCEISA